MYVNLAFVCVTTATVLLTPLKMLESWKQAQLPFAVIVTLAVPQRSLNSVANKDIHISSLIQFIFAVIFTPTVLSLVSFMPALLHKTCSRYHYSVEINNSLLKLFSLSSLLSPVIFL